MELKEQIGTIRLYYCQRLKASISVLTCKMNRERPERSAFTAENNHLTRPAACDNCKDWMQWEKQCPAAEIPMKTEKVPIMKTPDPNCVIPHISIKDSDLSVKPVLNSMNFESSFEPSVDSISNDDMLDFSNLSEKNEGENTGGKPAVQGKVKRAYKKKIKPALVSPASIVSFAETSESETGSCPSLDFPPENDGRLLPLPFSKVEKKSEPAETLTDTVKEDCPSFADTHLPCLCTNESKEESPLKILVHADLSNAPEIKACLLQKYPLAEIVCPVTDFTFLTGEETPLQSIIETLEKSWASHIVDVHVVDLDFGTEKTEFPCKISFFIPGNMTLKF